MDIERTLETQQLRLFRIVAGLVLVLGVLTVGPVSRRFSEWTLGFVGSVLSRVELAVRYLVITQACLMVDQSGLCIKRNQIAMSVMPKSGLDEADASLSECRRRLRVLRSILMDLPRHALRLLYRIAKQIQQCADHLSPWFEICRLMPAHGEFRGASRIERPPDKDGFVIAD